MSTAGASESTLRRGEVSQPHIVQFYSDDGFLTDELTDYFGTALSSGSSAVIIATKAHIEVLFDKLKNRGIDVAEVVAQGRCQALDATEVLSRFFVNGSLDEQRFHDAVGGVISQALLASRANRVVAFGEMVALLWAEGDAEKAIELEKLWNALAKSYSFTLRCAYSIQGFRRGDHEDLFLRICAEHSHVIPEDSEMAPVPEDERLRVGARPQEQPSEFHPVTDWRKRERRFRLMVEALQGYAIFMLDTQGRVISWNPGAERIKGYKFSEIIDQHFSRFYLPEDIESGKPQKLMQRAIAEGGAEDEGWRVRKGGERFWAHVTLTAVHDEAGTLIGFGKVTRDMTEHKRAEEILHRHQERFRLFVEGVQDYALFMLDSDGYISTWNTGAERIKGYKAAEVVGQHFSIFYPEEDVKARKPERELEIAAREGRLEDEGWRIRKDGSKFWANVVITAIKDENGEMIGFGKVTRDLTERMFAQEKIQGSERSLRELSLHLLRTQDEERRRIGRDIHDSLGQYLSVLKMKLDTIKPARAVENAAECARLVDECIKEVRTISYLLYPPMLEEMGLATAIPWYLDGFSSRSGIKTTFSMPDDFDRLSRDAELALFRVLQESLTNVQRHSGSSRAQIRLARAEDSVVLEVSDQGKGVPAGLLEQSGSDWMGSLGVGLRGMSERLRQLGGSLEVSSSERGTRVRAAVPAAGAALAAPQGVAPKLSTSGAHL